MIQIDSKVLAKMIVHGKSSTDECCGFILGRVGRQRTVSRLVTVRNAHQDNKRFCFQIASNDYLSVEIMAEEQDLEVMGVYHSHQSCPAIPSEYDRIAAQPGFSYLILAMQDGAFVEVRSWQLDDEYKFQEEKIDVLK